MKWNALFGLVTSVLLLAGCGLSEASPGADLDARIHRVENGLVLNQTIADRMAQHRIPGMSVAVVSDYEVAWTKGMRASSSPSG